MQRNFIDIKIILYIKVFTDEKKNKKQKTKIGLESNFSYSYYQIR